VKREEELYQKRYQLAEKLGSLNMEDRGVLGYIITLDEYAQLDATDSHQVVPVEGTIELDIQNLSEKKLQYLMDLVD
jgi:hypothetical protein